ncbi:hypothetical protein [Paracidobacterium acidisoli]|nr:hypothetical protein [Paracidobacterium acidisoli]MBT9331897.1 hypothetical protein [Paracidobacterium acidisoli]
METFAEVVSVVGALLLSVSCGLLVEELVFGGLARLFFAQQPKTGSPETGREQERKNVEEEKCLH